MIDGPWFRVLGKHPQRLQEQLFFCNHKPSIPKFSSDSYKFLKEWLCDCLLLWNTHQVSSSYACWMKRGTDCWPSVNPSFPGSLSPPSLIQEPLENLPASLTAPSVCLLYIHSGLWLFFLLCDVFTIYFLLPEIWQKLCFCDGLGFYRFMSIFAPYYHLH